jgi:hypothetical protein
MLLANPFALLQTVPGVDEATVDANLTGVHNVRRLRAGGSVPASDPGIEDVTREGMPGVYEPAPRLPPKPRGRSRPVRRGVRIALMLPGPSPDPPGAQRP